MERAEEEEDRGKKLESNWRARKIVVERLVATLWENESGRKISKREETDREEGRGGRGGETRTNGP